MHCGYIAIAISIMMHSNGGGDADRSLRAEYDHSGRVVFEGVARMHGIKSM